LIGDFYDSGGASGIVTGNWGGIFDTLYPLISPDALPDYFAEQTENLLLISAPKSQTYRLEATSSLNVFILKKI
jgi:hypothetical protein